MTEGFVSDELRQEINAKLDAAIAKLTPEQQKDFEDPELREGTFNALLTVHDALGFLPDIEIMKGEEIPGIPVVPAEGVEIA